RKGDSSIMTNAISVENLSMTYDNKGEKNIAVDNISFTVDQGEIFSFLGPSGAGKTTTQRILTTLLPIENGEVSIAGYNVLTDAKKVRANIGYVSQLGGADPNATVRENLELTGKLYGLSKKLTVQRIDKLSKLLDFQNRAKLCRHIKKLRNNGITIFLTSHYLEEADALSNRLVILDQGKIVAEGTPTELKKKVSGEAISLELKYLQDVEKINVFF